MFNLIFVGGAKWTKHTDHEIEFYCTEWKALICSRCMFFDHNGHQLSLLDQALDTLISEMGKLEKYYEKQFSDEYNKSESTLKCYFTQ